MTKTISRRSLIWALGVFVFLAFVVCMSAVLFRTQVHTQSNQSVKIDDDSGWSADITYYGLPLPVASIEDRQCFCVQREPELSPNFVNIALYLIANSIISFAVYLFLDRRFKDKK